MILVLAGLSGGCNSDGSEGPESSQIPAPELWIEGIPRYPGIVRDPTQGATSVNPGRNYRIEAYTVDRPYAEVVRFYKHYMKDATITDEQADSIRLKIKSGTVAVSADGVRTRIRISSGPY